jgi:hypothetical protein
MAKETIGLLMARLDPVAFNGNDEMTIATAFLPVEQSPDGKVRVLSQEQGKKMLELGLRPMVAVRSEVTRHGTKMTHRGYELHFLEGVPAAWREVIEQYSPMWIESMLEDYYEKVHAKKGAGIDSPSEPRRKAHAARFWQGLARDGSRSVNVAVITPSTAITTPSYIISGCTAGECKEFPRAGAADQPA